MIETTRSLSALAITAFGAVAACTTTQTSATAPAVAKCQVSASNAPVSFDATGGSGTITITASRDCAWSIASTAGWVMINGSSSGQGPASVGYHVAPNPVPASRTGSITVGSDTISLSQAAAPCHFGLSRTADSVGSDGGRLSVDVTTLTGCSWTASSGVGWIAVTGGASGAASGTVSMSVAANTGAARAGQALIAGQTYVVTQAAAPSPKPPQPPKPTPTPAPPPSPPPTQHVSFSGTAGSVTGHCPNLSMTVGGRTVVTDSSTKFKHLDCGDIKAGTAISVDGTAGTNGVVHADQVDKG